MPWLIIKTGHFWSDEQKSVSDQQLFDAKLDIKEGHMTSLML